MPRPTFLEPEAEEIYAWLADNGIEEWLPDNAAVHVDDHSGQLTYTAHAYRPGHERGWDRANIDPSGAVELRTVSLESLPTDRIRDLFRDCGLSLFEGAGELCIAESGKRTTFTAAAEPAEPVAGEDSPADELEATEAGR